MQNLQRSFGNLDVKFKNNEMVRFFQEGSSKAIIPNVDNNLQQMILTGYSAVIFSHSKE